MANDYVTAYNVLSINAENINSVLAFNELVIIVFYQNSDQFNSTYSPIFDKAAAQVAELYPVSGKVIFGKADCNANDTFLSKFQLREFPDIYVKVFICGKPAVKEYLGYTTVQDLVSYVQKRLEESIQELYYYILELSNLNSSIDIANVREKIIFGYFENEKSPDYEVLRKVSMNLMDVCKFYVGFGKEYRALYPNYKHNKPLIIFRLPNQPSPKFEQEIFKGNSSNYESLNIWATKNCLLSTFEITFENANEIRKGYLPYLVLFYKPEDLGPVEQFKKIVKTDLEEWRTQFNFLTADGVKFTHKLEQIEKRKTDLPFILLDSFNLIYEFPENANFTTHHQLKNFVEDYFERKKNNLSASYRFNLFSDVYKEPVKLIKRITSNS